MKKRLLILLSSVIFITACTQDGDFTANTTENIEHSTTSSENSNTSNSNSDISKEVEIEFSSQNTEDEWGWSLVENPDISEELHEAMERGLTEFQAFISEEYINVEDFFDFAYNKRSFNGTFWADAAYGGMLGNPDSAKGGDVTYCFNEEAEFLDGSINFESDSLPGNKMFRFMHSAEKNVPLFDRRGQHTLTEIETYDADDYFEYSVEIYKQLYANILSEDCFLSVYLLTDDVYMISYTYRAETNSDLLYGPVAYFFIDDAFNTKIISSIDYIHRIM